MPVEVLIEEEAWVHHGLDRLSLEAFNQVMQYFNYDKRQFEISILGCDDKRIKALNVRFRQKDSTTNVLSWPTRERRSDLKGSIPKHLDPKVDFFVGDIAISFETCSREAKETGKNFAFHVSHLLIHGMLHLMGFDHENDLDATFMERIEIEILGKMGMDVQYMDIKQNCAFHLDEGYG